VSNSFKGVGINLFVGSDGSSLGGFESAHGGSELDPGEAELLAHGLFVSPSLGGSGSGSSVSGGSDLLVVDHLSELRLSGPAAEQPEVGDVLGVLSLLDGLSSLTSPLLEGCSHSVDVPVGGVNSPDGSTNGLLGSDVMGVGSAHGGMGGRSGSLGVSSVPLGNGVSSDGSVVGSDSSLELLGESVHELSDEASVVVGPEVGEGVVASTGSESHVLLDVLRSGSVGSSEGGHVVEERKISEVAMVSFGSSSSSSFGSGSFSSSSHSGSKGLCQPGVSTLLSSVECLSLLVLDAV